jgi:fermentation-respiration switch protein FrsA (DUF1100 family)
MERSVGLLRSWMLMRLFRWSAIGTASLMLVWLAVCLFVGILSADWALHPPRRSLTASSEVCALEIAERYRAKLVPVNLAAIDGVILRGWYLRASSGNNDAVILLHGQSDNRAGMLDTAELMLKNGYSVLLPDARGHGQSGGDLATYGVKESRDIQRWFDWLAAEYRPNCIDGLGDSMGAAELLQSLSVEKHFCAVVAESSFASFREASYDRIGEWIGTGPWVGQTIFRPVVWFGLLYARMRYGVDLSHNNPGIAVANSNVPVLLIHGLMDTNLPPRNSEMILSKSGAQNSRVVLWEPKYAGHCGAATAEPYEYDRRVLGWFEDHNKSAGR